jgi:hypothetical protein
MTPYEKLSIAGSLSSMLGLLVSLHVLLREWVLQRDMTTLKNEEEAWHKNDPRK